MGGVLPVLRQRRRLTVIERHRFDPILGRLRHSN
jgi:hypothetical protein